MISPSPAGRAGWGVAVAATLGMSVSYIDRQTLAAIAPSVRSAFDLNHTQFGWLVSGFSMAYLVGAPAAGTVLDKLGARRGFALAAVLHLAARYGFRFAFVSTALVGTLWIPFS